MDNHLIILGGIGPQASLKLHELLLSKSRNFHDGSPDKYPAILHASMQIPDFISTPNNIPRAVQIIQKTLQQLPTSNTAAIGMACNTAHLLVNDVGLQDFANFVSMIDAVVAKVEALGITKIGLLASPHTISSNLYQNALERINVQVLLPTVNDIQQLDQMIRQVIAGNNDHLTQQELTAIANRLVDKQAQAVLLGCSELPIVGITCNVPVIDSLDVLAGAMLSKIYPITV